MFVWMYYGAMKRDEEEHWRAAVAATLRAERAVAGLTQVDVERHTGIARTSYRLYEQGKRQPDLVQLAAIASAFRVPLSKLIGEMERRAGAQ